MLAVGRERAAARALDDARHLRRSQCRGAAVRRPQLRCRAPSRSASATCRASSRRSPRPIACSRSAAGFSAWNSPPSTCRASIGSTIFYSFNVIPALGRVVAGDAESYRYLVESIRRFPSPQAFAAMMRAAGFARVSFQPMTGGIVALHSGWRL